MTTPKPHIYCLYGVWRVRGGDWRTHGLACDFAATLNRTNRWWGS